jgi:L-asparaginase
MSALPRIAVFSLGGTIASTASDAGGVAPQLDAADLVAAVPQLSKVAQVETVAFRQLPGASLTLDDAVELAAAVRERLTAGAAGAVVTQGTDTIEEMAFALDLLVDVAAPTVVTGAMRNPTLPGADGPANVLAAVAVAAAPQAANLGCVVVLGDEIHAARFVRKTNTASPAAFASPAAGRLGWVVEDRPHVVLSPPAISRIGALAALQVPRPVPQVALVTMTLGDDGRLLEQVASCGYAGLVVEGFGGGHVPARAVPALAGLARDMPVVLASRTGAGQVLRDTYGFAGSERDLAGLGLVSAGFLDGLKARILLSLLLAGGADADAVRKAFAEFTD